MQFFRRHLPGRWAPVLLMALAACHGSGRVLRAEDGWVRLAAVPGRPAAAYFTLHGGPQPVRLTAVESPEAGAAELHHSMAIGPGGMVGMQPAAEVDVPAGGEVRFAPGAYHVMLFGLNARVAAGGRITLRLRFDKAPPLSVEAQVIGAGDPAPY